MVRLPDSELVLLTTVAALSRGRGAGIGVECVEGILLQRVKSANEIEKGKLT